MYRDSCIAQGADSCYPQKSRSDLNEDNRVVATVVVSYMYIGIMIQVMGNTVMHFHSV